MKFEEFKEVIDRISKTENNILATLAYQGERYWIFEQYGFCGLIHLEEFKKERSIYLFMDNFEIQNTNDYQGESSTYNCAQCGNFLMRDETYGGSVEGTTKYKFEILNNMINLINLYDNEGLADNEKFTITDLSIEIHQMQEEEELVKLIVQYLKYKNLIDKNW